MILPIPLLAISDRKALPAATSLPAWIRALATAGVPAVQLREKDLPDRAVLEIARSVRRTRPAPACLVVNARLDLAFAAGADGVHLPADEISIRALRERFGAEVLVGRSTHSVEEVRTAREEGADYVTFGPVFATPSKARCGEPRGLEALEEAAALGLPVLALGGVFPERFPELAARGARGAAGIRMFLDLDGLGTVVDAAQEAFGAA